MSAPHRPIAQHRPSASQGLMSSAPARSQGAGELRNSGGEGARGVSWARDPLLSGAIFRADPQALRSPVPKLLSPARSRFGALADKFDNLVSRSPMPKVLSPLGSQPLLAPSFATPLATGSSASSAHGTANAHSLSAAQPQHLSSSAPRQPSAHGWDRRPGAQGSGARGAGVSGVGPSPAKSHESEDMDIIDDEEDDLLPGDSSDMELQGTTPARPDSLKPPPKVSPKPERRKPEKAELSTPGNSSKNPGDSESKLRSKGSPKGKKRGQDKETVQNRGAKDKTLEQEAKSAPGDGSSSKSDAGPRAQRQNVKVLTKWVVKFKYNSKGAFGFVVEGFLVNSASGVASTSDESLQWKTSFIEERETATRLMTASGSVYVLRGAMDPKAIPTGMSQEMLEKFRHGFPEDFLSLSSELDRWNTARELLAQDLAASNSRVGERSQGAGKPGKRDRADVDGQVTAGQGGQVQEKESAKGMRVKRTARLIEAPRTARLVEAPPAKRPRGRPRKVVHETSDGVERLEAKEGAGKTVATRKKARALLPKEKDEGPNVRSKELPPFTTMNPEEVLDVSEAPRSRSGRKLLPPSEFWRRNHTVYDGLGTEREIIGISMGLEEGLKSPSSGRKGKRPRSKSSPKATSSAKATSKARKVKNMSSISKTVQTKSKQTAKQIAKRVAGKAVKRLKLAQKEKKGKRGKNDQKSELEGDDIEAAEELLATETQHSLKGDSEPFSAKGLVWDHEMRKDLLRVYKEIRPDKGDFWDQVASKMNAATSRTESVSAQQCHDAFHAPFPTPAAVNKKANGRRRPATPKVTISDQSEKQDEDKGEDEEDTENDGLLVRAHRGTTMRKREIRHVLSKVDEGHSDDIFDSTPFKKTPFREVSQMARVLAPKEFTAPTPEASKSKEIATSLPPGTSPGLLKTPGLEGRDGLDAYIDRTRARARIGLNANIGGAKSVGGNDRSQGAVSLREVKHNTGRLVAQVKELTTAKSTEDDEEAEHSSDSTDLGA